VLRVGASWARAGRALVAAAAGALQSPALDELFAVLEGRW
jgi:hypothetical protein